MNGKYLHSIKNSFSAKTSLFIYQIRGSQLYFEQMNNVFSKINILDGQLKNMNIKLEYKGDG